MQKTCTALRAGGQTDIYMTQIPSPLKASKNDLNNDSIVDFKDLAEFVEQRLATKPRHEL